ncbi:MAG: methyl-accepting chemotaxis protein, partial [Acidovorax sp.]|uniref:methyl-accepting chemotaxis protein n=1 Tax=Acidovorax sp. TaxID=1872122 RepID=UPI0039E35682
MRLDDLRVSTKLWAVIAGLLLASAITAGLLQNRLATALADGIAAVSEIDGRIATVVRWRGSTETGIAMLASTGTTDEALAKYFDGLLRDVIARNVEIQARIEKETVHPDEKRALEKLLVVRREMNEATTKVREIKASGDGEALRAYTAERVNPLGARYLGVQDEFIAALEQRRDAVRQEVVQTRLRYALVAIVVLLAIAVVGLLLAWRLVRSITRPLDEAVAVTDAIAAGDLTRDIQSTRKDEFGHMLRSLAAMTARLRGLVGEVRTGVDAVSTASVQIANGNHDLSVRTEQTASNLQETAASMEQLTATVSQSADTARQANQLAGTAAQAAARGGEVVGQVVQSMQQITDSSRKISDIIGVIDSIAFQTNILALNAAVEAARAGEQGRGFAVVASEVRSLAGRSAEAAKEIKALIGKSVENVETGSAQVAHAGQSMEEIVASVRRVSDLIGEISASSTEQRDGIAQVNQAVTHLDQMTQQNAALVEESTAAAASMRDQAQRLAEVVSVFNVGAVATRAPAAPKPAPRSAPA